MRGDLAPALATVATLFAVTAGCGGGNESAGDSGSGQAAERRAESQAPSPPAAGWLGGGQGRRADLRGPSLVRAVEMGVACPNSNSIRCDRIGVAVDLRDRGARRLSAWVAGREVEMRPIGSVADEGKRGQGHVRWRGYLQPAGLIDGPLHSLEQRDSFHWIGKPAVAASVRIVARSSAYWTTIGARRGSSFSARYDNVPLSAGFG